VRPLVLERQPRLRETPKASGFNGQIVELLRYRGLLDRVEAASGRPARGALPLVRPTPASPEPAWRSGAG
jgi:2-polyprenyl-6-methoxyphenol hydroxylase-like FAD-dependent oxidoreductase